MQKYSALNSASKKETQIFEKVPKHTFAFKSFRKTTTTQYAPAIIINYTHIFPNYVIELLERITILVVGEGMSNKEQNKSSKSWQRWSDTLPTH